LGATPAALEVVQLPADGSRWVGWLLDPNAQPRSGRLSLVMDRAARPGADDAWAGLFLDQWTETIPANRASTGIAFHYDNPGAEAAQMLLLAVPPTNAPIWDLDSLISILLETLDLAMIRGVDMDMVAQLLPATYLADNVADDTVSTDFGNAVMN